MHEAGDGRCASADIDNPPMSSAERRPLTYEQSGVRYDLIDPLKVQAQRAAAATASNLSAHGLREVAASRGESAYVVDVGPFYLASIVECLGSKALVADEMERLTGRCHYGSIAQDTLAMAVNDLITVGATPLVVQAYWAAGSSEWFSNRQRSAALVEGWKRACDLCGVSWGGGETPALAGIVDPERIDLAAGCTGIVQPKSRLSLGDQLTDGDAIVLLASSGIHANGLSLARALAQRLPEGYLTPLVDGRTYGEALLDPTVLYAPVTEAVHRAGIPIHYAVNITGHGWRKLLRHPADFTYRIDHLPPVPPVLDFIRAHAGLDEKEAYGTLNMGAGFALFVANEHAQAVVQAASSVGVTAWSAGVVQQGPKRLLVEPLRLVFGAQELDLR